MDSLVIPYKQFSEIIPHCKHVSTITLCKWWDYAINREDTQTAEVYWFGDMYIVRHEYDERVYFPEPDNDEQAVFDVISMLMDRWEVLGPELSEGTRA